MVLTFIYALLLVLGGVIGYLKAGSTMSLVMGVASGAAVAYCAMLENRKLGNQLILVIASGLLVFMGMRFYNSGKFMPAGLVTVMSAVIVVRSYMAL
ncbi:hypothetical protein SAMD00019534_046300 [Acytostelium subglobosum LB1]|uniref:hypothetical protein n=1 Tax=Acytostelium subglobosum LB1 TaxID=1410327 RepID=UPI000644B91E|nr:hypothetical protein SAMD00019534_046300 [Acytostelium subglobosum LB1]GAM21455.1 hypothetical protein SAMD00019534_046300 [Acytostelium subglobosum LB1]|eukprot:XP_012755574.1 hypothetical protein SAMD00019534_046300 [Acytostelium subglobosum LB1]